MQTLKWTLFNPRTLVFKIFISFLSIILLFSVFNVLSIFLFNKGVQNEVIRYNRLMLQNSADRYRTHFERVRTMLFDMYRDEHIVAFNRQLARVGDGIDLWQAKEVLKTVRAEAFNPMYYLHNLLVYFEPASLIVDKEGTVEAEMMFSRFYISPDYSSSYWQEQFDRKSNYVLHPEGTFTINGLNASETLQLIPFSFRMPSSRYQVIALMDGHKLQQAFYGTEEDNRQFMITDEAGTLIYRSSDALSAEDIPSFEGGREYVLSGDHYYFAEKDESAGLTYITAVPSADITSRVRSASLLLLLLFAVSIVMCVLASLYFSRKINRPVKEMLTSLLRRDPVKVQSKIQEFDLIQRNIGELMKEKETIHRELLGKRSLLTSFGYINKLKAITSDINDWKDIAGIDEPFVLVLYQLHFKSQTVADRQLKTDRMAYYIQEYINVVMSERMPSSHTFQIENNQILSLIRSEEIREALDDALEMLKAILDRDKEYLLVTIAVSSVHDGSAQFNAAYREVLDMARQARPLDGSQIIRGRRTVPDLLLTVPQEQELYANLQAGNHSYCISFMDRTLDQMDKKGASIQQLRELAGGVISRVAKILGPSGADGDASMRQHYLERMGECFTIGEFKRLFAELFDAAAAVIQSKKEKQDPTIALVMDIIETKFADDLSLDLLADKLNLSAAYLSVYIKEKTGTNFSEHLNAVRIRKAKEMLADTDLSVQEISLRIGYRNVTSFIRMFKKITGIPPGEYRKNKRLHGESKDG